MNLKGYQFYKDNEVVAWYDMKFANLYIKKDYASNQENYLKELKDLGYNVIDVKEY